MAHAPRGLIALLVGTVVFFALWIMVLKPSPSTKSNSPQSLGALQTDVNKAHQAVATSNATGPADAGTTASTPATTAPAAATPRPSSTATTTPQTPSSAHPATPTVSALGRLNFVNNALRAHKVVALLFYNPAGADDRAVKAELATIKSRGKVVTLAVPLTELTRYPVVTNQVPVTESPTLVLINRSQQATTIIGFADRFEIAQRVVDALAAK
jgi:hypothetical protein